MERLRLVGATVVDGTGAPGVRSDVAAADGHVTFVRVLGRYARGWACCRWRRPCARLTSLPAARLGRPDRGVIRAGARADLVAFDPPRISDRATFQEPHQFADGVEHVNVNGQLVIDAGTDTGVTAGAVLRAGA